MFAPQPRYETEFGEDEEFLPAQPYRYEYGVQDADTNAAFAKSEKADDGGVVTGSYKVKTA